MKLEQQVVGFARNIYPKLATTITPILKNFALDQEQKFIKMMDENKISKELETQELCLAKKDELEEMQNQLQDQKGKLDVIESLQKLDSK